MRHYRTWPWLAGALLDWAIIAAAMVLWRVYPAWPVYLLAWIIVGNRQHALGILGHDGGHRLISRNRRLNDLLTNLFVFWPLGVDLQAYRRFHFAHHHHLGSADDPELRWKGVSAGGEPPVTPRLVAGYLLLDVCGLGAWESRWFFRHYRPRLAASLVFWAIVGLLAWRLQAIPLAILWFHAYLTSYWAWFRLRVYTEHWGVAGTHRFQAVWWQRAFCPHNTWCHWEHHRNPAIPFWALPQERSQP